MGPSTSRCMHYFAARKPDDDKCSFEHVGSWSPNYQIQLPLGGANLVRVPHLRCGYTVPGHNISQFSPLTAQEQAAARTALGFWDDVANITFTDLGNSNAATIAVANYSDQNDGSGACAFVPATGNTSAGSFEGDVFMNLTSVQPNNVDFGA